MVIATTRIVVAPENTKELFQTVSPLLENFRRAEGCLSSRLYQEVGDDTACVLIEEWESESHRDKHIRSDDYSVWLGVINVLGNGVGTEFRLLLPSSLTS